MDIINIYKMAAQDIYFNIQRRLFNTYERGHLMNAVELNDAIERLVSETVVMITMRRNEHPFPMPPAPHQAGAAPYIAPRGPNVPPLGANAPPPPQATGPYTAPLRIRAQRRNPLEKTVTLSRANFNAILEDSCAICLENHKKGDTIKTECNHEFGKECYKSWITSKPNHDCPTCRKVCPRVTLYKTKKTTPIPFIIEDEDVREVNVTEVDVF